MMLSVLFLAACSSTPLPVEKAQVAPGFTLISPDVSELQSAGSIVVKGYASQVSNATLNGEPLQLNKAGTFVTTIEAEPGLTALILQGTVNGETITLPTGVLAGETGNTQGFVPQGISVHLGNRALNQLGPIMDSVLNPDDLNVLLQDLNPIVDASLATVYLDGLSWDPIVATARPVGNRLQLEAKMKNFQLPLLVEAGIGFLGVDIDTYLSAEEVTITAEAGLDVDVDGNLVVHMTAPVTTLSAFEVDVDGLWDFLEDLLLTDGEAAALIEDQLQAFSSTIPQTVNSMMGNLNLDINTELLGSSFRLFPKFTNASITNSGVHLDVDLLVEIGDNTASLGPLFIDQVANASGSDIGIAISDDLVNRFLYEMWAGGMLDLDMALEPGNPALVLVTLLGGSSASGSNLSFTSGLPPVWKTVDGQARMQLVDGLLSIETPGSKYGEVVELWMSFDAAAAPDLSNGSIGVDLSDAKLTLVAMGEGDDRRALEQDIDSITDLFAGSLGLVGGMLSFSAADLGMPALDEVQVSHENGQMLISTPMETIDLSALFAPATTTSTN